jgi:hypothetical protein
MGLFGKWMASKSSLGGFAFTTYVGLSPRDPYALQRRSALPQFAGRQPKRTLSIEIEPPSTPSFG